MIVTIDGPAGAGKSSIARQVAQELGFEFLDTGALYRAVTLAALRQNVPMTDQRALTECAARVTLQWSQDRILLGDEDVTHAIRTPEVTAAICYLADVIAIRRQLSELQRQIARGRNVVTEGRDQGSEVFPHAECKIFLTASSQERARRRQSQLAAMGQTLSLDEILESQNKRDAEDEARPVGGLRAAAGSQTLLTDGLTPDEVLREILRIVADHSVVGIKPAIVQELTTARAPHPQS